MTYKNLARYDQAALHLQRVLDYQRVAIGHEDAETLRTASQLGDTYYHAGDRSTARKILTETLAVARRTLGTDHVVTISTMFQLGNILRADGLLTRIDLDQGYPHVAAKRINDLFGFVQAQQSIVDEHAYQAIAESLVQQGRYHR